MGYSYSEWVQLPDVELLMANAESTHWGDSRIDQADVFIRTGSGVDHPRGRYEWKRAFDGPTPQHEDDAYTSGWKGTVNYSANGRWYNSPDQVEYESTPGVPYPQPSNFDAGGDASTPLVYGYSWGTEITSNTTLSSFWEGSILSFHLSETVEAAGQLGTGGAAPTDPTDPLYDGLFDPGAQAIEFENATCTLLDLLAAADESVYGPEEGPGFRPDVLNGANWSVIHTVGAVPPWGYYTEDFDQILHTSDLGPMSYILSVVGPDMVQDWGLIPHDQLSLTDSEPVFRELPMPEIVANGGLFQFLVLPYEASINERPNFAPFADEVSGDMDDGSWREFRNSPRFALRATVTPTRIRARYFTEDPEPPPPPILGEVGPTRARFSG